MSKRKVVHKVPLVKEVAKKAHIPVEQADFIYTILMDSIYRTLKEGNDVVLPNIGSIHHTKMKEQRSNMTGQHIPPHERLKFIVNVNLARYVRVNTREYPIK